MTQPAIKKRSAVEKRLDRCKIKTLNYLLENYNIVRPFKEPFHFFCQDENGTKYVRVELDSLEDVTKEIISGFKKKCPKLNTIYEVRIFERFDQKPKRLTL